MAIINSATKPLLWTLPAFLVLGLGDGGERATAREWLFLGSSLATVLLLCVVKAVVAASGGGKIMHMVRWKRLLLRGLLLLAVGFMAFSCFLALEAVAGKLLGEEGHPFPPLAWSELGAPSSLLPRTSSSDGPSSPGCR